MNILINDQRINIKKLQHFRTAYRIIMHFLVVLLLPRMEGVLTCIRLIVPCLAAWWSAV